MNRESLFSFLIAQAHVMGLCNMSSFLPSSSLYALRALEALNNLASKYPLVVWFGVICLHFTDGEPMQKIFQWSPYGHSRSFWESFKILCLYNFFFCS